MWVGVLGRRSSGHGDVAEVARPSDGRTFSADFEPVILRTQAVAGIFDGSLREIPITAEVRRPGRLATFESLRTRSARLMQIRFGPCLLELTHGDITQRSTDAIVNAANSALAGGGGVDGAIHQAGGPSIMDETNRRYPQGCPTGQAVISAAGRLPCRFVIHTVGPVWNGGTSDEQTLLKSSYTSSLALAVEYECLSVAFPAISTGVYGYPADLAATHSLAAVRDFLIQHKSPTHVLFVLFDSGMYGAYARALDELIAE